MEHTMFTTFQNKSMFEQFLFYFREKVAKTSEDCQNQLQDIPCVQILCIESVVRLTGILFTE